MYNSQNLPLEKRKIIKKSLGAVIASLFLSLFTAVMLFVVLYSLNQGINQGYSSLFWAIIAFLGINIIFGGAAVLYQYLYYKFYYYNFDQDSAEIKKGVISNATGHVRYEKIQNIYVDQDVLDRILGLYDVHYETAGETSRFYSHVDGLNKENADKLVAFLNERVSNKDHSVPINSEIREDGQVALTENDDQRLFSRENVPIDKKIVPDMFLSRVIPTIIWLVSFLLLVTVKNNNKDAVDLSFVYMIVVSICLILFLGIYIFAKIWYKNFYFKFDSKGGVITEKVLSTSKTYVYYDRVQNINVSQSVIDRLFGLSRLTIETAAEGTSVKSIRIPGLNNEAAEVLKNFLLEKSQKYKSL